MPSRVKSSIFASHGQRMLTAPASQADCCVGEEVSSRVRPSHSPEIQQIVFFHVFVFERAVEEVGESII